MRAIISLVLVTSLCSYSFSQNKKLWLQYGDEAFKQSDYSSAVYFYNKIVDKNSSEAKDLVYPYDVKPYIAPPKEEKQDSTSAKKTTPITIGADSKMQYVVHQLAESHRLNNNDEKAEMWYAQSVQNNSSLYPNERYWYGVCLMKNEKYDDAVLQFEKYQQENPDTQSAFYKLADKKILNCYFALDPKSTKQGIIINELDTIVNSGSASFAANFFGDNNTIVFTSARKDGKAMEKVDPLYVCDLYISINKDSIWSSPKNMNSPISTPQHEGAGVLSPDERKFYFTRWSTGAAEKKECAIYMSRFMNGQWLQPMKLNANVNAEGCRSMHPSLNLDGSILFFSSDRPGGLGKMDIWACPMDEFGNAGTPFNLGKNINTSEDEVTPYYEHRTQTLYFSSDGQIGLGGLDVFKSYREEEDTIWSAPINLRAPINSSHDDSYFVLAHDQTVGYFSSDRKSCTSCEGGTNCMRIYSALGEPMLITLKGKVLNQETKQPIPNALITFKDVASNMQTFFIITNDTGGYSTLLREEMDYFLKAQKNKFFGEKATVTSKGITKSTELIQDFNLMPIPSGEMVIKGIEYDYDKATLRPQSKKILDKIYEVLAFNDNLIVELSSHTDSRGGDDYNQALSQERANSCVAYLVSKGIAKDRLVPKGYGETKLLATDDEISKMKTTEEKEAGHQMNRRTAFSIIGEKEIKAE